MRKYAETSDWDDSMFTDTLVPDDAEKLIARASLSVDGLLLTALYDTDAEGYPTDPAIAETLRDATLAQASYWVETGDSTGASDTTGSMSIGSVSLGGSRLQATNSADRETSRQSPICREILQNAGLISRIVRGL